MQVGRYRFLDRLAVGGMAEVFVAVAHGAEGFEKPVVIKRLLPELARMTRFQQMFLDEARIMLNLQHGNIVQILDMGRMEGVPFLTLEYVHGKDLRTVLKRGEECSTRMPHGLAAYIVGEACRALDYAHRKTDQEGKPLHIVHRDVNPANIFISHEGEVKVGDFGLAKARDNLEQSDAGIIKGKFSYLSPEQAMGQPLDGRSDIFSLGVTLYEMTCGVRPFEGETDIEVVMKVREARFTTPSRARTGFSPELESIILKAMRRDASERFQTAGHMREEIARYLQKLPSPPSDRELMDFINPLFPERRSNSSLFRLTPLAHLPPPMAAVSHAEGFSEFHHTVTPSPSPIPLPMPDLTGPIPPPHGRQRLMTGPPFDHAGVDPRARQRLTTGPPFNPDAARRITGPQEPARTAAGTLLSGQARGAQAATAPARTGLWTAVFLVILLALGGAGLILYKQLRPAPTAASLSVTSTPAGASVFLDGADTGQRTPAVLLNLQPDREYRVVLRHPVGGELQRRFRFNRGGPHAYHFELGPGKETLSVESDPEGCDVLVGGELRGQTPIDLHLARGKKHAIELRKTGYVAKLVQHYAERDRETLHLELEPEPKPKLVKRPPVATKTAPSVPAKGKGGVLEIAADLKAKVFIDEKLAGRTPGFRRALPAGTYKILVIPDGAKIRHAATITVVEGKTHRLTLTATPTP